MKQIICLFGHLRFLFLYNSVGSHWPWLRGIPRPGLRRIPGLTGVQMQNAAGMLQIVQIGAETLGKRRSGGNGMLQIQIGVETLGKRRRSGGAAKMIGVKMIGAELIGERQSGNGTAKMRDNGLISGGSRSNRSNKGLGKAGLGGEPPLLPRRDPPQALQATGPGRHMVGDQRIRPQRHGRNGRRRIKGAIGKARPVFMGGSIWKGRVGQEDPPRQRLSGQTPSAKKGVKERLVTTMMAAKAPVPPEALAQAAAAAVQGLVRLKHLSILASAAEGAATVVAARPAMSL
jgi:hypothetical protein